MTVAQFLFLSGAESCGSTRYMCTSGLKPRYSQPQIAKACCARLLKLRTNNSARQVQRYGIQLTADCNCILKRNAKSVLISHSDFNVPIKDNFGLQRSRSSVFKCKMSRLLIWHKAKATRVAPPRRKRTMCGAAKEQSFGEGWEISCRFCEAFEEVPIVHAIRLIHVDQEARSFASLSMSKLELLSSSPVCRCSPLPRSFCIGGSDDGRKSGSARSSASARPFANSLLPPLFLVRRPLL